MKKVEYEDLLKGYLLNMNDSLVILDCEYVVSHNTGYYLSGINCGNNEIFVTLGKDDERHSWAKNFGNMVGTETCSFPELATLLELTKFVKDIYKTACWFEKSQSPSCKSESVQIIPSLPKRNKVLTHIKL